MTLKRPQINTTEIQFRISPADKRELIREARRLKMPLSECIRRCALAGVRYLRLQHDGGAPIDYEQFVALSDAGYQGTLKTLRPKHKSKPA